MTVEAAAGGGSERKRDRTRHRLLEVANRRFREHGYAATTAASIAEEAGVTERTFFRYFPSKADVLAYNWQLRREVFTEALTNSSHSEAADVVGEAMLAFAEAVRLDIESGVESVSRVLRDREAASAAMQALLSIEHDIAMEIGRRSDSSSEDFEVRTAAYATVGVFRAALRAVLAVGISSYITSLVDDGMKRVRPLYPGTGQSLSRQEARSLLVPIEHRQGTAND